MDSLLEIQILESWHELNAMMGTQALKANPNRAPVNLKVNANYITRFGQTALVEALDTVFELSGNREMNITF